MTSTPSMTDKIALIDQWCSAARILPVITIEREADILPLADALAAGGRLVTRPHFNLRPQTRRG